MFVYSTPSYPTYSPPTLYPHAHYVTVPSFPMARERYLRAVTETQAARARYMSELEEQHILAHLRQQEALRQAEYRQYQIVAAQNELTRRRLGRMYAENVCRPIVVPHSRRPAFVRQQRTSFYPANKPQTPLDLEALFSVLLGDEFDDHVKHQDEKTCTEETEMPNVSDVRAGYLNKLEAALKAAADRDIHKLQHSRHSGKVPCNPSASDAAHVPLARQAGVPRSYFTRDRAARTIQRRWRSHSADAAARHDAVATIATLRARFQFLRDTFSFPEHLEFKVQEKGDTMTPTLLFTSANTAVHTYIHELTKLLTLADAVSSYGSEEVRDERRTFVRLVEEALDGVDQRVAKVWEKKNPTVTIAPSSKDDLVTTYASVPIMDTPQPIGISSAGHSEAATTPDDGPRESAPYSDTSTDVSTIIPSRVESNANDACTCANDQAAAASRDVANVENPSEDEPVSNIPLARAEDVNDQGHCSATDETARDDHSDPVQIPVESEDVTEVVSNDLDSADVPVPSPTASGSSHSEAIPGGVPSVVDEDMTNGDPTPVPQVVVATGLRTSSSPVLALKDTTTMDSFDVVYPDSSSSSIADEGDDGVQRYSVSAEDDAGGEARSEGKRQVEDGFELL